MLAYYGSILSENITETPEGFLICKNVPISRTGTQEYLPCEIGLEGEELITVHRVESEVFNQAAMASFEGKCVTHDHPPNPVDIENVTAFGKGHAQNIRRGTGDESDLLLADLFITDPELIRLVKKRELREVSCGYECEYVEDEEGRFYQSRIRGNHIAVVAAGRAGSRVAIRDSIPTKNERGTITMNKSASVFARIFSHWVKDADPAEVASAVDELMENTSQDSQESSASEQQTDNEAPAATPEVKTDNDPVSQMLIQLLTKIDQKLDAALVQKPAAGDDDPLTVLEQELTAAKPEEKTGDGDEEAAVTVPADELPENATDEEAPTAAESEKPENPIPGADSAAILAAIGAIKPIIAKLPASERKAASDAAVQKLRASMGMTAKARSNGYSAINRVKKTASADSAKAAHTDDAELGRKIMSKHNPHYMKEEK